MCACSNGNKTHVVPCGVSLASARHLGDWAGALARAIFDFSPRCRCRNPSAKSCPAVFQSPRRGHLLAKLQDPAFSLAGGRDVETHISGSRRAPPPLSASRCLCSDSAAMPPNRRRSPASLRGGQHLQAFPQRWRGRLASAPSGYAKKPLIGRASESRSSSSSQVLFKPCGAQGAAHRPHGDLHIYLLP